MFLWPFQASLLWCLRTWLQAVKPPWLICQGGNCCRRLWARTSTSGTASPTDYPAQKAGGTGHPQKAPPGQRVCVCMFVHVFSKTTHWDFWPPMCIRGGKEKPQELGSSLETPCLWGSMYAFLFWFGFVGFFVLFFLVGWFPFFFSNDNPRSLIKRLQCTTSCASGCRLSAASPQLTGQVPIHSEDTSAMSFREAEGWDGRATAECSGSGISLCIKECFEWRLEDGVWNVTVEAVFAFGALVWYSFLRFFWRYGMLCLLHVALPSNFRLYLLRCLKDTLHLATKGLR